MAHGMDRRDEHGDDELPENLAVRRAQMGQSSAKAGTRPGRSGRAIKARAMACLVLVSPVLATSAVAAPSHQGSAAVGGPVSKIKGALGGPKVTHAGAIGGAPRALAKPGVFGPNTAPQPPKGLASAGRGVE